MKAALSFLFIFTFLNSYSQDELKLKQIDLIVSNIKGSTLPVQRDTIIQNSPEIGLKMTTCLSMIVKEKELIKYVNFVNSTMTENGVARQITSSNTFYYDHNNLIKVEEYLIEGDKMSEVNWYYADDKLLYNTLKSSKAESRAELLLTVAKAMQKQIIK